MLIRSVSLQASCFYSKDIRRSCFCSGPKRHSEEYWREYGDDFEMIIMDDDGSSI
jgi:hypothetical protein